jgi:ADP-heptose:LPS heptosyltransferase
MRGAKEKTLVIFPGALGDFVCFLPALRKIIRRHRRVDVLARSEYAGLLARVPLRSIEHPEISRLFSAPAEEDERLRAFFAHYENIYSWIGSREPDFIRSLRRVFQGELRCFPSLPAARIHATDFYLSCVGGNDSLGEEGEILDPVPPAKVWARRYSEEHAFNERNVLFLAPGSGGRKKNWPVKAYRDIADWWEREMRGLAVTILGPVEAEDQETIKTFDRGACVLKGLELEKVAALFSYGNLYLGNDSGLTHLSAALGVKTVAIFGPTDPVRWAPRGPIVKILRLGAECSPCDHTMMDDCPHRCCLTSLSVKQVALGIAEWLYGGRRDGAYPP